MGHDSCGQSILFVRHGSVRVTVPDSNPNMIPPFTKNMGGPAESEPARDKDRTPPSLLFQLRCFLVAALESKVAQCGDDTVVLRVGISRCWVGIDTQYYDIMQCYRSVIGTHTTAHAGTRSIAIQGGLWFHAPATLGTYTPGGAGPSISTGHNGYENQLSIKAFCGQRGMKIILKIDTAKQR